MNPKVTYQGREIEEFTIAIIGTTGIIIFPHRSQWYGKDIDEISIHDMDGTGDILVGVYHNDVCIESWEYIRNNIQFIRYKEKPNK